MPFRRGTDGSEDDLPEYIRRAFGHDRTWMVDGLCHPTRRPSHMTSHTWALIRGERREIDGAVWNGDNCEATALRICEQCPAQWLCTRWAILVDERTGTWGLAFTDLRWLKKQPDAENIVDVARVNDVPVQVAVRMVRAHRV